MNAPRPTTDISKSLAPLREVVSSLVQARGGTIPAGADRAKLVRRARAAGPAVVPRLIASLRSADEPEAELGLPPARARRRPARDAARSSACCSSDALRRRSRRARSACSPICRRRCRRTCSSAIPRRCSAAACASCSTGLDIARRDRPGGRADRRPGARARGAGLRRRAGAPRRQARRRRSSRRSRRAAASPRTRCRRSTCSIARPPPPPPIARPLEALERGLEYLEAGRPRAARRRLERFVAEPARQRRRAQRARRLPARARRDRRRHRRSCTRPSASSRRRRCIAGTWRRRPSRPTAWAAATWRCATTSRSSTTTTASAERRAEAQAASCAPTSACSAAIAPGRPACATCCAARSCSRAPTPRSPRARTPRRAIGFENVLALVPRHYPSWGNLGAAYLALDRTARGAALPRARARAQPRLHRSPSTICC